jgi:outer membrane protein TolC
MPYQIIICLLLILRLPAALSAQTPIPLSLKDAVAAALEPEGNTRVQLAREMVRQAEARAGQIRAALLPEIGASVGQQSRTVNLSESGLAEGLPSGF